MLDILTQYMKAGIKDTRKKELGVEVEHFIVDRKTKKAFSYYGEKGVRHILLELMKKYPEKIFLVFQHRSLLLPWSRLHRWK